MLVEVVRRVIVPEDSSWKFSLKKTSLEQSYILSMHTKGKARRVC